MQKHLREYALIISFKRTENTAEYFDQLSSSQLNQLHKELMYIPAYWDVSELARETVSQLSNNVSRSGMSFLYLAQVEVDDLTHEEIRGVLIEISRREAISLLVSDEPLYVSYMFGGEKGDVLDLAKQLHDRGSKPRVTTHKPKSKMR